MENPYIIIDDLLPQETADDIEAMLFKELPWRFISDITYDGTNQNTPAMSHVFLNIEWGPTFAWWDILFASSTKVRQY